MPAPEVKCKILSPLLVVAWLVFASLGLLGLSYYGAQAGEAEPAPRTWPEGQTRLAPVARGARLVFFAHPRCPCSRASLAELERLLARVEGEVAVEVAMYRPLEESDSWTRGPLWELASGIPGVELRVDPGGVEAARFGAGTSGHVVCYDAAGVLRYSGGLTRSRGHEGQSSYTDALVTILRGGASELDQAPTYGCSIRGQSDLADCSSAACPAPRLAE